MIQVLIIDDSRFTCQLMASYLKSCSEIEVVGTAQDGVKAIELIKKLKPSVITLDLEMPGISGLDLLEEVMYKYPTPVVVVSGVSSQGASKTLKAINLGAVDFILKYSPGVDINPEVLRQEIITKVRLASQIRVIRALRQDAEQVRLSKTIGKEETQNNKFRPEDIIVIGASTGGPVALKELLSVFPRDFSPAIIVVQHMLKGFTKALAEQLDRQIAIKVKEAQDWERLEPSTVYIAPADYHLLLNSDLCLRLGHGPVVGGFRPSIDVTMQSVSQVYGYRTKGVILTGMGSDGINGLFSIRSKGGKTFAQSLESCVVTTMPKRAKEQGLADHIASPERIGQLLILEQAKTK
ncbi:MAG: chemotaxis-specific protein-glutamate methyltransferase CheB [Acidobacteria bacterium]|nr:chemotaxis-specific protein-glutamate methyltransferase CheB [Acidobacteriota bacterium]